MIMTTLMMTIKMKTKMAAKAKYVVAESDSTMQRIPKLVFNLTQFQNTIMYSSICVIVYLYLYLYLYLSLTCHLNVDI